MSDALKIPAIGTDDSAIRLDVPTMEKRIADYPEDLKVPVLWLAGYLREKHNRNLDLLVTEARQLKIEFDKTTWNKVLRGRYQKDANGEPLDTPVVNRTKLIKAIQMLREFDDRRQLAGKVPFILTPTAQTIMDFIDKKRAPDRVNKVGLIVGHTGTQKTSTLREYSRHNNHGTGAMLESPANGSLKSFITDLAYKFGCSRQSSTHRKEVTIAESVGPGNYIIVENVQRLYKEQDSGNQRVFNFLQKLQDETECTIILTLTPVFMKSLTSSVAQGYFEQFIGRAGGTKEILKLEEFPSDEDVLAIAEGFGLKDAAHHIKELAAIVREPGRVRVLFEALQEAKVQAGKKELTMNIIRQVRGED